MVQGVRKPLRTRGGEAAEAEDFDEGDVEIDEAEAADGAADVVVHPELVDLGRKPGDPIDVPRIQPRENGEEDTEFEAHDYEEEPAEFVVPAVPGRGGLRGGFFDGRGV